MEFGEVGGPRHIPPAHAQAGVAETEGILGVGGEGLGGNGVEDGKKFNGSVDDGGAGQPNNVRAIAGQFGECLGAFGAAVDEALAFIGDNNAGLAVEKPRQPVVQDIIIDNPDFAVGMVVGGAPVEDLGFEARMPPKFPLPVEFDGGRANDNGRAVGGVKGQVDNGLICFAKATIIRHKASGIVLC